MSECEHFWSAPRGPRLTVECLYCAATEDRVTSAQQPAPNPTVPPGEGTSSRSNSGVQWVPFNTNAYVRVKLNDQGRAIHRAIWDGIRAEYPSLRPYSPLREDAEGWSRWQLWSLMQDFGPHISLGRQPPFATDIEFEVAARSEPLVPTGAAAPSQGETCAVCGGRGTILEGFFTFECHHCRGNTSD